jgi:hypothetical protein
MAKLALGGRCGDTDPAPMGVWNQGHEADGAMWATTEPPCAETTTHTLRGTQGRRPPHAVLLQPAKELPAMNSTDPAQTTFDRDLAVIRTLIREDSFEGDVARNALGLRWSIGPSAAYPAKRLVTDYVPISAEERNELRKGWWSGMRRTVSIRVEVLLRRASR